MPGMDHMADGNGCPTPRTATSITSKDDHAGAGKEGRLRFHGHGPDGQRPSHFRVDQTKRMHFYAIRSD